MSAKWAKGTSGPAGDEHQNLVAFAAKGGGGGSCREDGLAPTLSGQGDEEGGQPPAISAGTSVRRLMPVECERLQALPDGWTDLGGTPDSKRYAALGDAVTASVAEWIGRRLIAS